MESNAKGGRGGQKPNAYFLYGPGDVDFNFLNNHNSIIMFLHMSVKLISIKKILQSDHYNIPKIAACRIDH